MSSQTEELVKMALEFAIKRPALAALIVIAMFFCSDLGSSLLTARMSRSLSRESGDSHALEQVSKKLEEISKDISAQGSRISRIEGILDGSNRFDSRRN